MQILDILKKECLAINQEFANKTELLKFMIELASNSGDVKDKEMALADVLEREKVLSTGVGKGIALPHAKTNAVQDFVIAITTLRNELEYDSLDSDPIKIIILLLGPEGNIGMNLKILSKISRMLYLEEFRKSIIDAESTDEILSLFAKYDKN